VDTGGILWSVDTGGILWSVDTGGILWSVDTTGMAAVSGRAVRELSLPAVRYWSLTTVLFLV
jgi:hypothetical protein